MKPETHSRSLTRREAIQWMLTASASLAVSDSLGAAAAGAQGGPAVTPPRGYGLDPDMVRVYQPGALWPLTFTPEQRRTVIALCDVILPADETSPAASAVGVPDFLDEWVSSPYPAQAPDRSLLLEGLAWVEAESQQRFGRDFAALASPQQTAICDDICHPGRAKREHASAVRFFKRFRDLTAGGYYTTPEGMKAIGYQGNVPLADFPGPPMEALRHVGLA
ncbi:MAG TPA: gluconate 2-dehydrogenase subunit 3 family protein [Opitutaceae bacterium]|nr:gluconate 2-dehydrogenase subunit 3 family protein [Opitutaceae bacterium]